jgi:hypothetical protein
MAPTMAALAEISFLPPRVSARLSRTESALSVHSENGTSTVWRLSMMPEERRNGMLGACRERLYSVRRASRRQVLLRELSSLRPLMRKGMASLIPMISRASAMQERFRYIAMAASQVSGFCIICSIRGITPAKSSCLLFLETKYR